MAKKFERLEKEANKQRKERITIPEILPIIPMRSNTVIFPGTVFPFYVGREKSLMSLEESMENTNQILFIANQEDITVEEPKFEDLYSIGTVVRVLEIGKLPDGTFKVLVEGITRGKISEPVEDKYLKAKIDLIKSRYRRSKELTALMRMVKDELYRYVQLSKKIPPEAMMLLENVDDADAFADISASLSPGSYEDKQNLLETVEPKERLTKILDILAKERELLELEQQLDQKVRQRIEKTQKEYYLKEKLRAIREELSGEEDVEIKELKEKIEKGNYPTFVKEKAFHEIGRLEKMSPYSPEASVIRNYLDWILNLPWNQKTEENNDIFKAEEILEKDHYGLEEPKKRILEFLASRSLSDKAKAPIICFVGPPGVGKTSLAKSIAKSLDRKFERMSLGGLRDEAEIRGHRRTYVGALPGRIIQLIRKAGVSNPVILLDEVDKMGISFQGDPASALLEVLDPEQNKEFTDHYLEIPFDLSDVLFITTANVLYSIPDALRDRMEVIEISSYTDIEKFHIAKKYIIPKIREEFSEIKKEFVTFKDDSIKKIINEYAIEPGVRELDRMLHSIFRKAALDYVKNKKKVTVDPERIVEYLGPEKIKQEEKIEEPEIGIATGLAWTPYGGTTLYVETAFVNSNSPNLVVTGQLGDVMKESVRIALSVAKNYTKTDESVNERLSKCELHIHVPEGAVPKDGPSAGITLTTALISLFNSKPVRNDIAMTGEITLRGKVLPVGGIKEKVLAAYRKGITTVILPEKNRSDIEKIPQEVKEKMKFIFVKEISEVLKEALIDEKPNKKRRTRKSGSNT